MALSVGGTRVVISSNPDVAREILNSSFFADRPVKESAYRLMFHRAIGFAPYGEYWRHLRRIAATHLFAPKRIAAFESQRQIIADSMVHDISCSMSAGGSVRVREIFQRGSLNNVMGSVFGRSYDLLDNDSEARELSSMVKEGYELLGMFNWADHIPLLRFLDMQRIRKRCSNLVPRVYAFVQKIIHEHRAAQSDNNNSDFVDVLLALEGDQKLKDEDMVAVLWEMIFRGTDTVAIVMEWTLARLVLHRDIQAKVHEELDRVVGESRRVSESDIPNLEYLQAVVKEVLRMHPPGPLLSWARLATHDVVVGGHLIPAGTTAMVNMWAITHDEENWKKPHTFCPGRFLPAAGGEEVNIMGVDLRLAPFGSGRRVCPGKTLGLATINLWLARLLHHFEWIPALPDQPVDLSEVLKLSCEMRVPLSARVIPRSINFNMPMAKIH
jgi:cytochrome P450